MYTKLLLSVILFNIQIFISYAQGEHNVWYFGDGAGLDFNTTPPTALTNGSYDAFFVKEAASTMCDKSGNLLFYSNSLSIWDKNHHPMPNGINLYGGQSSTMGALITPVIGNPNQYYLFTVDGSSTLATSGPKGKFDGLNYSIIDMTLPGNGTISDPLGDVMIGRKNVSLLDSTEEKLTAIIHENGKDYWIITKKYLSSDFYAFLVTENGVCSTPVISTSGLYGAGHRLLIPSYDGNALASIESASSPSYIGRVQLHDFDKSCGIVSNGQTISKFNSTSAIYYGLGFSPNDSLIYTFRNSGSNAIMLQYKRYAPNISATEKIISLGSTGFYPNLWAPTSMRKGPNDTVYLCGIDSTLHILKTPNQYGNPGFEAHAVKLNGVKSGYELNNYFEYNPKTSSQEIKYAKSDTTICDGSSTIIGYQHNTCNMTFNWTPSIGLDSTDISNPTATPQQTTTYILEVSYLCSTWYDTITVYIQDGHPDLFNDTTICHKDSTIIGWSNASSHYSFSWSPTTGLNNNNLSAPTAFLNTSATYIIDIDDQCVSWKDTIMVNVIPEYSTDELHAIKNTTLCEGDSLEYGWQDAPPHFEYSWKSEEYISNSNMPHATLSPPQTHSFGLFAQNQCQLDSTKFTISVENCGIYVPNAFSPNNDNENDIFKPIINGKEAHLAIYDERGVLLYQSSTDIKWDGYCNNKLVRPGTYTYNLKYSDYSNNKHSYIGNITAIR